MVMHKGASQNYCGLPLPFHCITQEAQAEYRDYSYTLYPVYYFVYYKLCINNIVERKAIMMCNSTKHVTHKPLR